MKSNKPFLVWAVVSASMAATAAPAHDERVPIISLPKASPERAQILDAMRPLAEHDLGRDIRFVVKELSIASDWALVNANVRYRNGHKMDWRHTPYFKRLGHRTPSDIENGLSVLPDCCQVVSILQKTGTHWRVVEQQDTATDAWWVKYCDKPARVAMEDWCKTQ